MTAAVGAGSLELRRIPGYLIRRAQQLHNALWVEVQHNNVTPPQYAVLATLAVRHGLSQGRTGELASIDKSSIAEVVDRLVARGWVLRAPDPLDRRRRQLQLTASAGDALRRLTPSAALVQQQFLSPIPVNERERFVAQLLVVCRFEPAAELVDLSNPEPALSLQVPGHLIRCAQQVHTAIWLRTFGGELTGPQYAILHVLAGRSKLGQRELGALAALDKSTAADLLDRLVDRKLVLRERDPSDRRAKLIRLSGSASRAMPRFSAGMLEVQRELLEPLHPDVHAFFVERLAAVAYGF